MDEYGEIRNYEIAKFVVRNHGVDFQFKKMA